MYARRLSRRPASLAVLFVASTLALLLFGAYASPASASVDIELIGQTLSENGYSVDSGAKHLRSDEDLDKLRGQLETDSKQPVYVTVLPAGASGAGLARQLAQRVGSKATYVVLVGDRMEVASTSVSARTATSLAKRATAKNQSDRGAAVIEFVRLLNQRDATQAGGKAKKRGRTGSGPSATATPTETVATQATPPPPAAEQGLNMPILIGGLIALVAIGAGGFLWLRRQRNTPRPAMAGAGAAPSGTAEGHRSPTGSLAGPIKAPPAPPPAPPHVSPPGPPSRPPSTPPGRPPQWP
jgi:hypothetical protein